MQTDVVIVAFQSIIVLFAVGILGFWIVKRRIIPADILGLLSSLAINIALPSLVFANIVVDFSPEQYTNWWQLPLWFMFFSVTALVLTMLTRFVSKKETRHEFALSLFFQNGMFFPLIVLSGIFGHSALYIVQLFLFAFLHPSIVFSTYFLFFGKPRQKTSWKRIINPVLMTTLLALLISLFGLKTYVPEALTVTLQMLGGMAMPLLIIILGGNIYNDFKFKDGHKPQLFWIENIKFVIVKNLVFPAVFLGILLLLRPDYSIALIIILQSAVPPITATPLLTERSGGNRAITSQFIITSFIFSILSIPAVLYVFSLFFPFPA
jgi:malate permease and related proteins